MSSQIDKLKAKLEVVDEDQEEVDEEENMFRTPHKQPNGANLTMIQEEESAEKDQATPLVGSVVQPARNSLLDEAPNVEFGTGAIMRDVEPESFSHTQFMSEAKKAEIEVEEWIQETLVTVDTSARLVDYFMLNTKIFCMFADLTVQMISFTSREVEKSLHLSEIEFECPEDDVIACALERDVQLVAVAFANEVHIFEFDEEATGDDTGLSHVTKLDRKAVKYVEFAEYYLVLMQATDTEVSLVCAELDSESFQQAEPVPRATPDCPIIIKSSTDESGSPCVFFAVGTMIGKLEVPSMARQFFVSSEHSLDIRAMTYSSSSSQIVTTSPDETIRFFSSQNGASRAECLEEMEACDCVNALGANMITRLGTGEERGMILWRFLQDGGVEEDPVDEIELTEEDRQLHDTAECFRIKSGRISSKNDDADQEQHVLLFGSATKLVFKLLFLKRQKY